MQSLEEAMHALSDGRGVRGLHQRARGLVVFTILMVATGTAGIIFAIIWPEAAKFLGLSGILFAVASVLLSTRVIVRRAAAVLEAYEAQT